MQFLSIVWPAIWLTGLSHGQQPLTGFPGNMYDPYCAMACVRSLSGLLLDCSSMGETIGMMTMTTTSDCWAKNEPFLTTMAWCIHSKCEAENIPLSKLEFFWETQVTGQSNVGITIVPPKWSYSEALATIHSPPTFQLLATDMDLNTTALVPPSVYQKQINVLTAVQEETTTENGFGIAMLVTGFGTPIVLTWLGYVPLVSKLVRRLKPYLIWPSTIGTYSVRPLPYNIGNAPTFGQAFYVAMFLILNIVFSAANYKSRQPSAWYADTWHEKFAYVMYRTGAYAWIMAPLIFLFGGRNNILLWMTNWSHSTFLVLHRWVARIYAIQVLLHSILALALYKNTGMYDMEYSKPYWVWGIVATLCVVVLTFGSQLFVRNFAYEAFLLVHIVLSVILVVGCWYHYYELRISSKNKRLECRCNIPVHLNRQPRNLIGQQRSAH